ncbi:MAG TPA: hypothetical protein DEH25_13285 [Chloroflexi bacterium]|nr:hypothetical protein [Chloroflexota bacterium]HBY07729.1 hypothetical protein [Chloroflexota bacterium]
MSDGLFDPKASARTASMAYGLWLFTAILSVLTFMAGREIFIRTYARFFPWDAWQVTLGQGGLSLVNILISLPMAILAIVIIIGGFEYQHRNIGKPQGWLMLARTLAVESGFLLLALYI